MTFATVTGRGTSVSSTADGVTLPAGIVAGELLVCIFAARSNVPFTGLTASAGWTKLGDAYQATHGSAVFWRTATATTADNLDVTASGTRRANAVTFRIANGGTPVATVAKGTGLSHDPPSQSVGAAADVLWIAAVAAYASSGSLFAATAAPSGFGNLTKVDQTNLASSGDNGIGTAELSANAAAQDPGVFTAVGSPVAWSAWTVAVPYAGGAGPTAYPLAGAVAATSTTAGAIGSATPAQAYPLAGAVAAVTATAGNPTAAHPLAGTSTGTSSTAGTVTATHPLAGAVAATSTTAGTITASHPLAGTTAAVTATSGTINLVGGAQNYPLAGLAASTTTTTGTIRAKFALAGGVAGTTTTAGTIGTVTGTTGYPKVWTGSTWVKKPGKVWTGTVWAPKPFKTWTGSTWKTLT